MRLGEQGLIITPKGQRSLAGQGIVNLSVDALLPEAR
jgi:hypothetical protein